MFAGYYDMKILLTNNFIVTSNKRSLITVEFYAYDCPYLQKQNMYYYPVYNGLVLIQNNS